MLIRNTLRMLTGTAAALLIAAPALAVLPEDVRPGTRVEAEGNRLDDRTLTADEVEIHARRQGKDEVKGQITAVDAARGTLRIHGIDVVVNQGARIEDANGGPLELSDFSVDDYAKAEGVYRDGAVHIDELEIYVPDPGKEKRVELAGAITMINRGGSSFEIMGIEVLVTPQTAIEMK